MAKIKNLQQLSDDLLDVYSKLKEGNIEIKKANSLSHVAGRVIDASRVMLRYNSVKKNVDKITLLETK